ncbi:HAD-IA family hydrolase [Caenimonas aquaedulcis]|uniref:HAD-IA family hydrolase n=1 Tax=Caenimonas aquaedulcis TaxID=2793270 RepID=A0A931MII9_9BURK|nr:HAD-IA family hydrolase [Caenimonas aquaedulcis]MBG9389884.1 HAD-IA family hydrolase [Caenimonas aquaedulcis]
MPLKDSTKRIRAVFFDYDGVLTTDKTGSLTTCRYLSERTGIDVATLSDALRPYNEDLTLGRVSHADVWPDVCKALGQSISMDLLAPAFGSTPVDEPMFSLARALKQFCRVGIITDNKKDRIDYLRQAQQLDSLFDPIVVSAEFGATKQGPVLFEAALARAGVEAGEAVFIDNSPANLIAPRALGFHTFHFDDATRDVAALRFYLQEHHGLPAGPRSA